LNKYATAITIIIIRLRPAMLNDAVDAITLPYKNKEVTTKMLSPHKVFATIFHANKDAFWQRFLGGDHMNVGRFWKQMTHHPSYIDHPGRHEPDFHSRMVPLDIHWDGVPVIAVARKSSQTMVIYSIRHQPPAYSPCTTPHHAHAPCHTILIHSLYICIKNVQHHVPGLMMFLYISYTYVQETYKDRTCADACPIHSLYIFYTCV
jgi:hypothetical protein